MCLGRSRRAATAGSAIRCPIPPPPASRSCFSSDKSLGVIPPGDCLVLGRAANHVPDATIGILVFLLMAPCVPVAGAIDVLALPLMAISRDVDRRRIEGAVAACSIRNP